MVGVGLSRVKSEKKKMIILENIKPKELSPVLPKKIQKDFVVTKWGGKGGGNSVLILHTYLWHFTEGHFQETRLTN